MKNEKGGFWKTGGCGAIVSSAPADAIRQKTKNLLSSHPIPFQMEDGRTYVHGGNKRERERVLKFT